MQNKDYKRILTFALVLSMMMPIGSVAADSDSQAADGDVMPISADDGAAVDEDAAADESAASDEDAADEDTAADEDAADEENSDGEEPAEGEDTEGEEPAEGEDTEGDEDAEGEEEEDSDELPPMITDEEALASCELITENDNMIMYLDEENKRLCFKVKSSGKCWWTSPINAEADPTIVDDKGNTMKSGQIKQVGSLMAINVGNLEQSKRNELPAPAYSNTARVSFKKEANGVAVTCDYTSKHKVKLTMHYELKENSIHCYVNTSEIVEKDNSSENGMVTTKLILNPYMGAVSSVDINGNPTQGYMIVPDGSGAVINYNNGKTNYASYSQKIYGRDYTAVPLTAPRVTEQAYLPVMATVEGNSGLVAVVTEGNANVSANAQVSGQNKQAYNSCYFTFETRSTDEFFMSGTDSNKITVFEKGDIQTEQFGIEYFPIDDENGVNYADCAAVYRDYLVNEKGLTAKTPANDTQLYVDTYGAVLKEESIIGIPITMKKKLTTFSQASEIASSLKDKGVDNIVMNYNDWTNLSVKDVVADDAKACRKLGKTSDLTALNGDGLTVYGSVNNFTMQKGRWGYFTLTNTAIRVSSAYSRQSSYSPAFGVAEGGVSPALIAPNTYVKIFNETLSSFTGEGVNSMGYGDWSTKLVSDFSKKNRSSRDKTMNTITNGYKDSVDKGQKVIAAGANSYVLPYVNAVTDIPVYSSGFNITDLDIPFYQMVLHGYVPYSTEALNGSSDGTRSYMRALAAGSNVNYDMIYEDADELIDTRDDDLFYSHYSGWLDTAANQFKVADKVLAPVSDYTISDYQVNGDVITTTYSKDGAADVVIEVDTKNRIVKSGSETIDLVAEGAADEGGAVS